MFRDLKNEARIFFTLKTKSPLSIQSGEEKSIHPTLPDNQCIKSRYQGRNTVIIPGSSLKGVIRSRYEKLAGSFGVKCCEVSKIGSCCQTPELSDSDGQSMENQKQAYQKAAYQKMCPACKLFGSVSMASRIYIADAFPIGEYVIGKRSQVGINRITGAAQSSALYDFEVVEEGSFQVKITLKNYELYQFVLLLYVLQDLNDGYITVGSASTRGYGRMEVKDFNVQFRDFRKDTTGLRGAIGTLEIFLDQKYNFNYTWESLFYGEARLETVTLEEILEICKPVKVAHELKKSVGRR